MFIKLEAEIKAKSMILLQKTEPNYCQLLCHQDGMNSKEIGEEFLYDYEEVLFLPLQKILSLYLFYI